MKIVKKIIAFLIVFSLAVILIQTSKALYQKNEEKKFVNELTKIYKTAEKTCKRGNSETKEIKNNKIIKNGIIKTNDNCDVQIIAENGKFSMLKYFSSGKLYNIKENLYDKQTVNYNNGSFIYYDVDSGQRCLQYNYIQNLNNNKRLSTSGCMKWYFYDQDNDEIYAKLLLDHNIILNSSYDLTEFNNITKGWKVYDEPSLLTVDDFNKIKNYNDPYWLNLNTIDSNTSQYVLDMDLPYGYFLNDEEEGTDNMYAVDKDANIFTTNKYENNNIGFRPVIKVAKVIIDEPNKD